MALAGQLTQGIDLWINTPRRPWEACGTSGMKVLVNGGLNLSERDGWWAEAYRPELGWALGDGEDHGDNPEWNAKEAEQLYQLLEQEVIPCFYERDTTGIPNAWVERMRSSMAELTPRFSTNRMLREYVDRIYLPAVQSYRERVADKAREAVTLCRWRESLEEHWEKLHFGRLDIKKEGNNYIVTLAVYLDELDPEAVQVQLYAEPQGSKEPEIYVMDRGEKLTGAMNGYLYHTRLPVHRPAGDYTPRIVPFSHSATVPLEERHILWY
jgi:starch phosphorylase